MRVAAKIAQLSATEFIRWGSVLTVLQLVVQWVEQGLDEGMWILTVKIVFTPIPVAVFAYGWALLRLIEEHVGWSSEVLLTVSIVTLWPFMFLVDKWTERCFIAIEHKFFKWQHTLQFVQVDSETTFVHQSPYQRVFFGWEWQWVELLLLFIQGVYFFRQVVWREVVQPVRWVCVSEHDNQRSVEVGWTVHFEWVCIGVSGKFGPVAFQE